MRYSIQEEDPKRQGILITDTWFAELTKHPYHSSNKPSLTVIEKPGTGIFLMKERTKLVKVPKNREQYPLAKRISDPEYAQEERKMGVPGQDKRLNLGKKDKQAS